MNKNNVRLLVPQNKISFQDLGTSEFKVWLTKNSALAATMLIAVMFLILLISIFL